MNAKNLKIFIIISLLLCLALVFLYPHKMISAGKLSQGHKDLTTTCFACHSPFTGSSSEKCIYCHAIDEIGLKTTKGVDIERKNPVSFHDHLKESTCMACHTDHQGENAFASIQQFSHGLLTIPIENRCDSCHHKPKDSLHQALKGNCDRCHDQERWKPATFDHAEYFRFDRHHDAECEKCHINQDYNQYSCYECHEHSVTKIRSEHREEGILDYENCTECHRSGDEEEAERLWKSNRGNRKNQENREDNGGKKDFREHDDDD